MSVVELRKALKEKGLVLGSRRVINKLKNGKLKRVFLSSNCRKDLEKDVERYSKLNKTELIKLDKTNEEVGVLCKKPFSISVLGY